MNRRKQGREGEESAAHYLEEKGWTILERNYQNRYGEIDLIAKDGEVLVFIEVKTWKAFGYSDLEYVLDHRKRSRMVMLAKCFLEGQKEREDCDVRFDVIFYNPDGPHFEHIPNAFTETGKL